MDYSISTENLYELIDEEVSKVADEAYADSGSSLYDSIILTGKDAATVNRHIDDAVDALVARAGDIAKRATVNDTPAIKFYVPDMETGNQTMASNEITRYIVLSVCAAIFAQRRPIVLQEYATRAQAAMDRAIVILKTRKPVLETWS